MRENRAGKRKGLYFQTPSTLAAYKPTAEEKGRASKERQAVRRNRLRVAGRKGNLQPPGRRPLIFALQEDYREGGREGKEVNRVYLQTRCRRRSGKLRRDILYLRVSYLLRVRVKGRQEESSKESASYKGGPYLTDQEFRSLGGRLDALSREQDVRRKIRREPV